MTRATHRRLIACCLAGGVLGATYCAPATHAPPTYTGCNATEPDRVEDRLMYFRELVSSDDTGRAAMRRALGVPAAEASQVTLITRRSVCLAVIEALNAHLNEPGRSRNAWVYSLGSAYAVEDPGKDQRGMDIGIFLFDDRFNYLDTIHGF